MMPCLITVYFAILKKNLSASVYVCEICGDEFEPLKKLFEDVTAWFVIKVPSSQDDVTNKLLRRLNLASKGISCKDSPHRFTCAKHKSNKMLCETSGKRRSKLRKYH